MAASPPPPGGGRPNLRQAVPAAGCLGHQRPSWYVGWGRLPRVRAGLLVVAVGLFLVGLALVVSAERRRERKRLLDVPLPGWPLLAPTTPDG